MRDPKAMSQPPTLMSSGGRKLQMCRSNLMPRQEDPVQELNQLCQQNLVPC